MSLSLSAMSKARYVRQVDVTDEPILTIKNFALEKMQSNGREEDRWVLYFKETPRGLVLNQAHLRALRESFGLNDSDCVGKRVQLYVDASVTFGGRVTGGTRLRAFKPASKKASASQSASPPPAPAPSDLPFDDELP
jgi:hypothetical protein